MVRNGEFSTADVKSAAQALVDPSGLRFGLRDSQHLGGDAASEAVYVPDTCARGEADRPRGVREACRDRGFEPAPRLDEGTDSEPDPTRANHRKIQPLRQ